MKVKNTAVSYEYVLVFDKDENYFYLTMEDLTEILNTVKLTKVKKRVREYVKLK